MQAFPEYVNQLRADVRVLRIDKERLTRAHQSQKQKVERLETQIKEQAKRIKELERENERLKGEQEQASKTKNRYQVALFDHGNFRRRPRAEAKSAKEDNLGMQTPIGKPEPCQSMQNPFASLLPCVGPVANPWPVCKPLVAKP